LSTSGTGYHRTSWRHHQSIRSRTGWIDTGTIWAFKADSYIARQSQVTSNKDGYQCRRCARSRNRNMFSTTPPLDGRAPLCQIHTAADVDATKLCRILSRRRRRQSAGILRSLISETAKNVNFHTYRLCLGHHSTGFFLIGNCCRREVGN